MKLLFHSKPLVVLVSKDWANRQLLSSASQPLALVIQDPVPLLGSRPQGVGYAESQLALGSTWTALGEWSTDGGTHPAPSIVGRQVACDMVLS